MLKTTSTPEQVLAKLRQIEILIAQRTTVAVACRESGILDQT